MSKKLILYLEAKGQHSKLGTAYYIIVAIPLVVAWTWLNDAYLNNYNYSNMDLLITEFLSLIAYILAHHFTIGWFVTDHKVDFIKAFMN